ncbi:uncharacterized protein EAF02_011132 [Botrytis sinoallii]|uniref:uncharacterized protein n=1 Tax=Botrytis sinoallii TaxID=1463999 RepID=UPI0019003415|nr:uncharacterized protein EAF02_011132 [Botrytis sinoallii]KAF7857765.1 hypothetical protein EAF02_011132 [Botrytis sinoallii]
MVRFIPEDIPKFRKRVVDESDDQGLAILYFADYTTVTAEAVIGADGVKSHVRPPILGLGNHESHACYSYKSSRAATEQDTLNELAGWSKNVTPILSLLNEYVDSWAIFDMLDHPASTYAKEKNVLIGHVALAASPHHGSGAGFAIQDFAVLGNIF